jgi:transcriptional regulator of arginine metabolism
MASKRARQAAIIDIVGRKPVSSQEALSDYLRAEGLRVTQATLSRDIREIGLVKVRGRYGAGLQNGATAHPDGLRRAFKEYVVATAASGNLLMVRTSPGSAHSVGVALDNAQWPDILGTVAGDDTIFVLLRDSRTANTVLKKLRELME